MGPSGHRQRLPSVHMLLLVHLFMASYMPTSPPSTRPAVAHTTYNFGHTPATVQHALDVGPASARELITSEEVLRLAHEVRERPTLLLFGQRACRACRTL